MEVGSSFTQSPKAAEYVLWSGPPLSKVPQDDIRAKLEDAYSASWQNQSLEVVLGDVLGSAQIQFDIRPNTTTTLEKKPTVTLNMTASRRNLLRRILREFDLTYIVQEGSLEIVDLDYAKKNPTLHRYDLSYVTSNSNEANALKGTIMSVIEPNEWSVYGGNCSMGLFGPILHVRATEEMHHQIATLISKISR